MIILDYDYVDIRECVWVGIDVNEWFLINVGSRQSCMMSPWLYNVYIRMVSRCI